MNESKEEQTHYYDGHYGLCVCIESVSSIEGGSRGRRKGERRSRQRSATGSKQPPQGIIFWLIVFFFSSSNSKKSWASRAIKTKTALC